jgi:small subunit ribosomal protein S16
MVKVRLARAGSKDRPFYHIVVADQRFASTGRHLERIGYFNPLARGKQESLKLNLERFDHWVSKGAQPSGRVVSLVKQAKKAVA